MFICIRKSDGQNYETVSLEAMKNSIERHLKEKEYEHSLKDRVFQKALEASTSKKIELKKQRMGRQPNKSCLITQEEENKMFNCGALGDSNPRSLITTLFFMFGKLLGLRARDEARQMIFGDFQLKEKDGEKYLEFHEWSTKTRDGSNLKNVRDTIPRIYSSHDKENKRNPIYLYELYIQKRLTSQMTPDSRFFLTPIPMTRITERGETWFYPRPMGENTLGKLMKDVASMANIDKKVTNHSVRKTSYFFI